MKKIVDALNKAAFVLKDEPEYVALIPLLIELAEQIPEDAEIPPFAAKAIETLERQYQKAQEKTN